MEKKYWLGRKRESLAMAHNASSAEARLIHYDLAGRYSVKAATAAACTVPPAPAHVRAPALGLPLPRRDPDGS